MNTALVRRFKCNKIGRDFAVGDIHAHFTLLERALVDIGFDRTRDRLFSVGDLVDRGPEPQRALEFIAYPWFHAVRGNHEDMAMRFPYGWVEESNYVTNGGAWNVANSGYVRMMISHAFSSLPIAIQVDTDGGKVGIVHADCPRPTWGEFVGDLEGLDVLRRVFNEASSAAFESRARIQSEDLSGVPDMRAVIVGHTPVKRPVVLGNVYHIDTGGWLPDGHFTFINLATLETIPPMPKKLDWETPA